jgi:plastocyanin
MPGRALTRTSLAAVAVLGALLLLTSCADERALDATTTPVRVVDDEYSPTLLRIPVGGTVSWDFKGSNPHNVVSADGSWLSSEIVERGDRYERTFDEPGVFPYFCTFHGTPDGRGMAGTIVVGSYTEAPDQDLGPEPVAEASGRVVRVPDDFPDIQGAVDSAEPGDLVLVGPGVYREAVTITTPSITVRGLDRNAVVLEGDFERINGIQVVGADGVVIENMTARNYVLNGFYWTGVDGYRGSYLTAHNMGDYGIYAFAATGGILEDSYASNSRDSGFYIGQCQPCNSIIRRVVSEHNGLGYSGTNSGGELYIIESEWRDNMTGIVPNSLDSELDPPAGRNFIVGNLIVDNDDTAAAANDFGRIGFGSGIVLAGTVGDTIEKNLVLNHDRYGILATIMLDDHFYFTSDATVRDNVVAGSGIADLALAGPAGSGNCFEGNSYRTAAPWGIDGLLPCDGLRLPLGGDFSPFFNSLGYVVEVGFYDDFPRGDWTTLPAPPAQPTMPDPAGAPVVPALDVFEAPDLDAIALPELDGPFVLADQEVTVSGIPVSSPGLWQLIVGIWGYLLPILLLSSWVALATWDLTRRDDLDRRGTLLWLTAVFAVPFLGVVAYHAFGRSRIPGWMRGALVGGGFALWVLVVGVAAFVGGLV